MESWIEIDRIDELNILSVTNKRLNFYTRARYLFTFFTRKEIYNSLRKDTFSLNMFMKRKIKKYLH